MSLLFGFMTIALGFSISGAAASGFEALTGVRANFGLLRNQDAWAVAAVPVVTIGAAYILLRNVLFGGPRSVFGAMVGTVICGLWSLVIGSATLSAFGSV